MSSIFSSNSEAYASELLENIEESFVYDLYITVNNEEKTFFSIC